MSKSIWKYPIELKDSFSIKMPKGALVLTIQTQHQQPMMWVLVDKKADEEYRHFESFGTGHPMPDKIRTYVGTYQMNLGEFVFHVFEIVD